MDFLKNKVESAMSGNHGSSSNTQNTGNTATNTSSGQEDYGDKALDFIEKKTGHSLSREQNEKITDGARNFYEKETGSKVSDKFSN